jgi:hypothetical protein
MLGGGSVRAPPPLFLPAENTVGMAYNPAAMKILKRALLVVSFIGEPFP